MKQKCAMKQQMYRDIMESYRYVVDHYQCESQMEAYRRTVLSPAKRFYIHPRWLSLKLAPLFRGDFSCLENLVPLKRLMYETLFQIVVKLSRQLEYQGKSLYYLCKAAVMQPAPRYYVEAGMMSYIYNNYKRETRCVK